jgi:hypothetical protein
MLLLSMKERGAVKILHGNKGSGGKLVKKARRS